MNRTIDSTASEQRFIGRVDDGIDGQTRDIALDNLYPGLNINCHRQFLQLTRHSAR